MRITEIYVERLRSYPDYSNRSVGLKAVLDEGDDVVEVYRELAGRCEALLRIQEIQVNIEDVEKQLKRYEEARQRLEKAKEEFEEIREQLTAELKRVSEEVEKIHKQLMDQEIELNDNILKKLRKIREALSPNPWDP